MPPEVGHLGSAQITSPFESGAVFFLDALGFKGIWDRPEPELVLSKLRALDRLVTALSRIPRLEYDGEVVVLPTVRSTCLSDTVVIGCTAEFQRKDGSALASGAEPEVERLRQLSCVSIGAMATSLILAGMAVMPGPPLAYRGAVSFGRFSIVDKFVMGPAIDDAAESEALAEGAFVWMCPSAKAIVDEVRRREKDYADAERSTKDLPIVLEYPVPLKGGQQFTTHVINPFAALQMPQIEELMPASEANLLLGFRESFRRSERLDVAIKAQNTFAFLEKARSVVTSGANTGIPNTGNDTPNPR